MIWCKMNINYKNVTIYGESSGANLGISLALMLNNSIKINRIIVGCPIISWNIKNETNEDIMSNELL